MSASHAILLVDDDASVLESVSLMLRSRGFPQVVCCDNGVDALRMMDNHAFSVVLLDLVMPGIGGEEVLRQAIQRDPDAQVVVVTAQQKLARGVACMQLGASDYLIKPVDADRLVACVRRAQTHRALRSEVRALREGFFEGSRSWPAPLASIITASPMMFRVFHYIQAIAPGDHAVLVTGETGTGKELVARAIHELSGRAGPFVPVNIAGLDDALFSDALFGHSAGAFTGATQRRQGLVERAGAGTLFLDEIGGLSETSQVKLLRLLQECEYSAVGSDATHRLRARVIAAAQETSSLRNDLLYRLRGYHADLPPLRNRPGDIELLVDRFVEVASADLAVPAPVVSAEVIRALRGYRFPGNVRELRAMVLHAVADCPGDRLELGSFLSQMVAQDEDSAASVRGGPAPANEPLPTLAQARRDLVVEALRRTGGDRGQAAALLGIAEDELESGGAHGEVLDYDALRSFERRNIRRALERAKWRVSGPMGAAALLGLKPSTLSSRMKALRIKRETVS